MKKSIFFFFLSLYLLTASGHFYVADEALMILVTQSIVENHNFSIPKGLPYTSAIIGKDENLYSPTGIGQSIFVIPFYFLGKLLDKYLNLSHLNINISLFSISLFNSFITALTVLILFLFGLHFFSSKTSLILAFFYGLGTYAWPYSKYFFNQPISALFSLISVFSIYLYSKSQLSRHIFFCGLFLSLSFLVRIDNLIILPCVLLYFLLYLKDQNLHLISLFKRLTIFAIPVFFSLILIFLYNFIRFGDIFRTGYGAMIKEDFNLPIWYGIYGMLFSSGKSIFLYNPILLFSLFSWKGFYKNRPKEAILFLLIFLTFLFSYSQWSSWEGGGVWGPRFLIPTIPFLLIPIGVFIEGIGFRFKKTIIIGLFLISLFVQIIAISINFRTYIDIIKDKYKTDVFTCFYPPLSPIVGSTKIFINKALCRSSNEEVISDYREPFDFWYSFFINKGVPLKIIYFILFLLVLSIIYNGRCIFLKGIWKGK